MPRCALVLTDLVDSTGGVSALGDAAAAERFAAHDRLARDALARYGGREIDRSDGFLLLFDTVDSALDFARAYHRACAELGLAARAGIHEAEVVLRANPPRDVARGAKPLEVDGIGKAIAARVMALAPGGRTLLTGAARVALPPGTPVASHGHWQLKGVVEPMELYEAEAAAAAPPPDGPKAWRVVRGAEGWRPARDLPGRLPAERDVFVGREVDLLDLAGRLDREARLVSVVGIGGAGKTRLAVRYAWTWLGEWPGGAWFCDLTDARTVAGICHAVGTALDVPLVDGDPVERLGWAIRGRGRCLVVLDNFEQVVRHAPETLGAWLDRAREARFLVTTREVLGLPGEEVLALPPLSTDEGVALFTERARAASRGFLVAPGEAETARELVRQLDGMPLAIELAAPRVRVMPLTQILARLGERFRLLARSGARVDRQATLRASIDWSWDLLHEWEKAALAQCTVFSGGFTLAAAEGVLDLSAWPESPWAIDVVQELVDKSLVRRMPDVGNTDARFGLWVTVHDYAAERLRTPGSFPGSGPDAVRGVEERHGAHYAMLGVGEVLEAIDAHGGVARWRALAVEIDNLFAASRRAVGRGDLDVAVRAFCAVGAVVERRGPLLTGAEAGRAVLGMADLGGVAREDVAVRTALLLKFAGRMDEARVLYERSLEVHREVRDRRREGTVLANLGIVHVDQGRPDEARALYEEALAIHREVGNRRGEGTVLASLGVVHSDQGRPDEAHALYEQALAIHREVGNRQSEGVVLGNLAIVLVNQGRPGEARALCEEALAIHRDVGNRRHEGSVLGNLCVVLTLLGRPDETWSLFEQALAIHREVGDRRLEGIVLGNLGHLNAQQGRADDAAARFREAIAIHREVGNRRFEGVALGLQGDLLTSQGRTEEARVLLEQALSIHRVVGNRRHEGAVLGYLAEVERRSGHVEAARHRLEAAEEVPRAVGDPAELARLSCLRSRLALDLGDGAAAAALLDEARALAGKVGADPRSPIGLVLGTIARELEASRGPPPG